MSVRRILSVSLTVLMLAALLFLLPLTHVNALGTAPSLGAAANYAVMGGSTVTNTGNTVILGDLGLSPGTSITGFPPGIVVPPGAIHQTDTPAANGQDAITSAYNALVSQPCDFGPFGPTDLAGTAPAHGVWCYSSSVMLSGVLTLTGIATDVWVFKIGSSLTTGPGASVVGTGNSCNIFWQVTSSATLDTTTVFRGYILALQSITLNNGASDEGGLFARNGAATLINNKVDSSVCTGGPPAAGVGVNKIFSPASIGQGGVSTLIITLTNTNALAATLTSSFIDTLPSGLVIAPTPNVASSCGGAGAPTATPGGSTMTLPAGRSIPGGGILTPGFCTLTVDVTATAVGTYFNALGPGILQTTGGNNLLLTGPAGAALTVYQTIFPQSIPVGGEMLTMSTFRVVLPWLVLLMVLGIVAVQTLIIKRRKTIN